MVSGDEMFNAEAREAMRESVKSIIEPELRRLGDGISAAVKLRLLSGEVSDRYSPMDVAQLVDEAIDQQVTRMIGINLAPPAEKEQT